MPYYTTFWVQLLVSERGYVTFIYVFAQPHKSGYFDIAVLVALLVKINPFLGGYVNFVAAKILAFRASYISFKCWDW